MRLRCRIFFYAVALIVFSVAALAQVDPDLEIGFKPFGAYDETTFDSVSLANGNLTVHIPLFDYPQRGGLKAQARLMYNSKGWKIRFDCTQTSCEAFWIWENLAPTYGEQVGGMVMLQVDNGQIWPQLSTFTEAGVTVWSFSGQTLDGNVHQFGQIGSPYGQYRSIDASGIYFNALGGDDPSGTGDYVMLDRDGNGYTSSSGTWSYPWQDTNGNYFLYDETQGGWSDTLGRPLLASVNDGTGTTGCSTNAGLLSVSYANVYGFPGTNNSTRSVKLCYASLPMKTHFGAKMVADPLGDLISVAEYSGSQYVVQSVIVNDGTGWSTSPQWIFQYNDTAGYTDGTNYGDLTQVTLPTGGTIAYTWWTSENWLGSCTGSPQTASRGVASRTINANDGTGNQTTTYVGGIVTDPAGNDAVHTITGLGGSCSLYDTEVDYYKGSSNATNPILLKVVQTAYSWTTNPFDLCSGCAALVANVVPTSVTTKWPIPNTTNFLVSQVQTDYDNSFTFYPNEVSGGTYGLVTEKREYDYGLNAPGALLRKTDYTYAAVSGSSYLTANLLDLVTQKTVYNGSSGEVAQTTYSYDTPAALQSSGVTEQHTTPSGVRGNLTQVQQWSNVSGSEITTQQTSYYDTGMPYQATDLRGNKTTYSYSSANYGAYVTQTQYPNTGSPAVTHSISGVYDFNTGLVTSFTDQNSEISNYGYDLLGRITSASYPDGGSVDFSYNDVPPVSIKKTVAVTGALSKVTNSVFDGLGRVDETQLNDPDCTTGSKLVKVDFTYGNDTTQHTSYTTTTTPYCDTPGTVFGLPSRTDSDTLGRTVKITQTDGTVDSNSYAANTVGMTATVTDEAGITRETQADGLGRMTKVLEDPNNKNYETDYGYDTLNNLTSVTQKGDSTGNRNRTFIYDSLSRLTSATNPESGTISYTYSNSSSGCASSPSEVCTKTTPAANQTGTAMATTTYTYDALNRLTGKTYAGVTTPSVYYGYDHDTSTLSSCATKPPTLTDAYPISYRTAMCDGSGATSWSHDKMGRILSEDRTIGANTNTTSYAYNLDGSLSTLTYPNTGKVITYTPNSSGSSTAGRPASATDVADAINYVTGATYAPQGALASLTHGGAIFGAFSYNTRLQPLQIFYGTNTPPDLTGSTCPSTVGNIMHRVYNFGLGTNDDGDVYSIANCRDTTRTATYTYDTLNRISSAYTTASTWGETYTIDPWANLTNIAKYTGKTNSETLSCATANTKNQLNTCFSYDAAGNLTKNGSATYTYDAENRLTALSSPAWYYVYDGDGNRVEKCTSSTCPSSGTGTAYWRDLGGNPISESGLNGTVNHEYIFFNGQRVARRDIAGNTVHYYFSDHLGTHAVVMNAAGTQCEQDADYYPYGGVENDNCTTPVAQNYKFTGKERDSESGLDNFGARYNASSLGRFMSVDPIWVKADRIVDPQRLNLYAYGRNNPLKFKDPTGMDLKMGNCPSNMTVSMCEAAVTNSLKKEDRNHVHFVEGTGKNGLAKGEVLIQADKDYKSGSTNFTRLQGLVNDHSGVGVLNVESPTGAFPMVTVTGWSSKNGTTYANGTSTLGHLTDVDAFHGSTLFPLASSAWSLLGRYTPLPWTEVYVNSEDSAVELAVDVAHELVHVKLGDFGKNPGAAAHESPGHPNPELENQIREAEDEARANAQQ